MTPDLTAMIAELMDGWTEEVAYAVAEPVHTAACTATMVALTVARLRHYRCECPRSFRAVKIQRDRLPLLLELTESSYSIPVGARPEISGSAKLHPPVPGNLENYDTVMRMLAVAAWTINADWKSDVALNRPMVEALDFVRREAGARLANECDDAAALLLPAWRAARIHLGYDQRPLRLICDCGDQLALRAPQDGSPGFLECDGCPGRIPLSPELTATMVAEASRLRCKRLHEPDWRITTQGTRQCRECQAINLRRRKARKASDDARKDAPLDTVLIGVRE